MTFKPEPNKAYRLPNSFYHLPRAVQVMYRRIRQLVDSYARVDCREQTISYTLKAAPTVVLVMTATEAKRIFNDLYGDLPHA